jgi:hypothetical protein
MLRLIKNGSKYSKYLKKRLLLLLKIQYFYRIYPTSAPHHTAPHRTAPHHTAPYRTAPKRYFAKMPFHLNVAFLTHRTMQRYITSIVALNCNGKDHRYTNRYRYYRYRILKNKALQRP